MPSTETQPAQCPLCGGRNVLVVAVSGSIASHYCLACERLFAAEVAPGNEDPSAPGHPADHHHQGA